jgi:hypothetical protein
MYDQLRELPGFDLRVHRVDIFKEKNLASDANIRFSPIVYVYQDGEVINKLKYDALQELICSTKS